MRTELPRFRHRDSGEKASLGQRSMRHVPWLPASLSEICDSVWKTHKVARAVSTRQVQIKKSPSKRKCSPRWASSLLIRDLQLHTVVDNIAFQPVQADDFLIAVGTQEQGEELLADADRSASDYTAVFGFV